MNGETSRSTSPGRVRRGIRLPASEKYDARAASPEALCREDARRPSPDDCDIPPHASHAVAVPRAPCDACIGQCRGPISGNAVERSSMPLLACQAHAAIRCD